MVALNNLGFVARRALSHRRAWTGVPLQSRQILLERVQSRMDLHTRLRRFLDLDPQLPVAMRERGVQRGHRDRVASIVRHLVEHL